MYFNAQLDAHTQGWVGGMHGPRLRALAAGHGPLLFGHKCSLFGVNVNNRIKKLTGSFDPMTVRITTVCSDTPLGDVSRADGALKMWYFPAS